MPNVDVACPAGGLLAGGVVCGRAPVDASPADADIGPGLAGVKRVHVCAEDVGLYHLAGFRVACLEDGNRDNGLTVNQGRAGVDHGVSGAGGFAGGFHGLVWWVMGEGESPRRGLAGRSVVEGIGPSCKLAVGGVLGVFAVVRVVVCAGLVLAPPVEFHPVLPPFGVPVDFGGGVSGGAVDGRDQSHGVLWWLVMGLDSKSQQGPYEGKAGKGHGGGEHGLRGARGRCWAVGLLVLVHGAGFLLKAPRRGRGVYLLSFSSMLQAAAIWSALRITRAADLTPKKRSWCRSYASKSMML